MKRKTFGKAPLIALVAVAVLAICLIVVAPVSANAEENPYDMYLYPFERYGTVICTQLTVRSAPSTGATEYGKMKNRQNCRIVGEYQTWFMVDLASIGITNSQASYGFVQASLIKEDPAWIVLTKYTYMYTDPWNSYIPKQNGQQSGRVLLVISENDEFYCVQCREGTAGSSFIHKWDVGQYTKDGMPSYVVVGDKVPMYDTNWNLVEELSYYTIVKVLNSTDDHYYIALNYGTEQERHGWVQRDYIQRIIN